MTFVPLCCGPDSVCWQATLAAFLVLIAAIELKARKAKAAAGPSAGRSGRPPQG